MADNVAAKQVSTQPTNPFRGIGEVVVELGDDRNRNILFDYSRDTLRGWWRKANLLGTPINERFQGMPDLPGMYVVVDCNRRTVSILDPLNRSENAELRALASKMVKSALYKEEGPDRDRVETNCDDTKLKTALYYLRKLVDSKSAVVISGTLPSMEAIADLPGQTKCGVWDSNARARKFKEESEMAVCQRNGMPFMPM